LPRPLQSQLQKTRERIQVSTEFDGSSFWATTIDRVMLTSQAK